MKGEKSFNKRNFIVPAFYNFNMQQVIDLILRVTGEAGITSSKVKKMIEIIKTFDKATNVKALIDLLTHCP